MSSPSNDAEKRNGILGSGKGEGLVVDVTAPEPPPPPLMPSSTVSTDRTISSFSLSAESGLKTPTNQPMQQIVSASEREQMARLFIAGKGLKITYDDLCDAGKLRANRLMTKDFFWSPSHGGEKKGHGETTFREQFELLCNVFAAWRDLSRVFFDNNAMDDFLVIRKQRAGVCFMNAVTVYQHYVWYLRVGRDGSNHEMLDLSWYIRECFPKEKLEEFLVSGGGGSALEFWCELTGNDHWGVSNCKINLIRKSTCEDKFQERINEVCRDFGKSKEPALVTGFSIEKEFKKLGVFKYDYEPDEQEFADYGEECGKVSGQRVLHSMVLLGLWKDDEQPGKVWFLLQNFWATKYLVIVSGEYLAGCHAKIFFAPKNCTVALVKKMHVIDAHYSETETSPEEEEETSPEED